MSGNGSSFQYFHRLRWSGYDSKRGTLPHAFVFQAGVEGGVRRGGWGEERRVVSLGAVTFCGLSAFLPCFYFRSF